MTMRHTWTVVAGVVAMAATGCGDGGAAAKIASYEREIAELRANGGDAARLRAELDAARTRAFALEKEVGEAKARWSTADEQIALAEKALLAAQEANTTARELRAELAKAIALAKEAVTERDAAVVERDAAKAAADSVVDRLAALSVVTGFRAGADAPSDPEVVRAELERLSARLDHPVDADRLTVERVLQALHLERTDYKDRAADLEAQLKGR